MDNLFFLNFSIELQLCKLIYVFYTCELFIFFLRHDTQRYRTVGLLFSVLLCSYLPCSFLLNEPFICLVHSDLMIFLETPHILGCDAAETVLSSKTQDDETVDSEDGQGSPIASFPSLKNDELLASVEAQKDERNSLTKSSPSSTFCDEKSAYSSRVSSLIFIFLSVFFFY